MDLRFATGLTWFEQDDAGVTAVLEDRAIGREQPVRADHLIAADGNNLSTRMAAGHGPEVLDGGAVAAVARCRRLCATRREVFLPVQARQVVGAAC